MTAPVPSTCDLCDAHRDATDGRLRVLAPPWRHFGGLAAFQGRVATVQCLDDNTPVKAAVESPGEGRVLVVDGGGSMRRALLGGNLAAAAARNGWAGIVVDGCVRDVAELAQCALGIVARAVMPLPSVRRAPGQVGAPVQVGGAWVRAGDWLVADADGVVVLDGPPA
jgi:regulator of ribonuclease activity A